MLINPNLPESKLTLSPFPGTRIVQETFGLVGTQINDPHVTGRIWTLQGLYLPVRGRAVGGVRAKLTDQKDFFTFINQRDLEVLLNLGSPGGYCPWLDSEYVDQSDREWHGFCVDEDDLVDDLYERELLLRAQYDEGDFLPEGSEISRRIHNGQGDDYEELNVLLWDMDTSTGFGPDPRFETIENRWRSVERTARAQRGVLWFKV